MERPPLRRWGLVQVDAGRHNRLAGGEAVWLRRLADRRCRGYRLGLGVLRPRLRHQIARLLAHLGGPLAQAISGGQTGLDDALCQRAQITARDGADHDTGDDAHAGPSQQSLEQFAHDVSLLDVPVTVVRKDSLPLIRLVLQFGDSTWASYGTEDGTGIAASASCGTVRQP